MFSSMFITFYWSIFFKIKDVEDKITYFHDNLDERGLGWHFFSLGSIRADSMATLLKSDVPERDRISSIRSSLNRGIKHLYTVPLAWQEVWWCWGENLNAAQWVGLVCLEFWCPVFHHPIFLAF